MAAPFKDYISMSVAAYELGGPKRYEDVLYEWGHMDGFEDGIGYEKTIFLKNICPMLCVGVGMAAIGTYALCEGTYKYFRDRYKEKKNV